jgi:hypothetical protein
MTMSPRLLCAFLLVLAVLVVTEAQDPRRRRSLKDQILKGSESETKRDLKLLLNKLEAMRKRVSTGKSLRSGRRSQILYAIDLLKSRRKCWRATPVSLNRKFNGYSF